jgi:predicted xylose isomerase-like sugar epimerase
MQMISSKAGTRLAKAKAEFLKFRDAGYGGDSRFAAVAQAIHEFDAAAHALADELIANGYHDLDGGEG